MKRTAALLYVFPTHGKRFSHGWEKLVPYVGRAQTIRRCRSIELLCWVTIRNIDAYQIFSKSNIGVR